MKTGLSEAQAESVRLITGAVKKYARALLNNDEVENLCTYDNLFWEVSFFEGATAKNFRGLVPYLIMVATETAVHEAQRVRGGKRTAPAKRDKALELYEKEYQAKVRAGTISRAVAVTKIAKELGIQPDTARKSLRGQK